jgi:hypothetical protein
VSRIKSISSDGPDPRWLGWNFGESGILGHQMSLCASVPSSLGESASPSVYRYAPMLTVRIP